MSSCDEPFVVVQFREPGPGDVYDRYGDRSVVGVVDHVLETEFDQTNVVTYTVEKFNVVFFKDNSQLRNCLRTRQKATHCPDHCFGNRGTSTLGPEETKDVIQVGERLVVRVPSRLYRRFTNVCSPVTRPRPYPKQRGPDSLNRQTFQRPILGTCMVGTPN